MDVLINRDLLENITDHLYDLKAERSWWKEELRCNYKIHYNKLIKDIEGCEAILKDTFLSD